ncbi:hypothetical protein DQ04_02591020 [Trypanosoma grayi]|uniref:hypothetical protein n=1 Tax=Trypanosoma grayi TaxID=71804 RepID=UPI0004F401EE|nr:hypothetical protein DQ04_02591020 [Trypanosoma grayi]KEG11464.1 hypothetical protein DQ04_02591020 [Trypanosoma grayi]
MHVEFRISSIEGMCAFDAESFIRMHHLKHRSGQEASPQQALVKLPGGVKSSEKSFRPHVKIQFVFENTVCIESSEIIGDVERHQHEKQIRTNWDASEIRTKRYRSRIGDVIVASLPLFIAERNVKIRLVQLAPTLTTEEIRLVKASYPSYFDLQDTGLCIGIAKVSLRELLITNSGVCVTLQPKQSMVAAVEALNLNTVATNSMFGKDVGGSAVLTFQIFGVVFNQKTFPSLLCGGRRDMSAVSRLMSSSNNNDGNNDWNVEEYNGAGTEKAVEKLVELRQQMDSSAVRYVLIPYMVLIDTVLRINEALSWRYPMKTLLLLCIVCINLIADIAEMGLMLGLVVEVVTALRMTILFYRLPSHVSRSTDTVVSFARRRDNLQAVLYGSHNYIINSMVRARLFFLQGLQSDSYLELAFIFHRVRRAKRTILPCLTAVLLSLTVLSLETLMILFLMAAFLVHPLMLRVSFAHLRKTWSRQLAAGTLWKALDLSRSMRVSRVVQVTDTIQQQSTRQETTLPGTFFSPSPSRSVANYSVPPIPCLTTLEDPRHRRGMSMNLSPDIPVGYIRHTEETSSAPNVDSQGSRLLNSGGEADSFSAPFINSNITQTAPFSSRLRSRTYSETVKYESQQKSLLTFAVIIIAGDASSVNNSKNSTSNNGTGNGHLLQKFRRILQRAKALDRPPQTSLLREQYNSYFGGVLAFLEFLRRHCAMETYVTPLPSSSSSLSSPSLSSSTGGAMKLEQLVHPSWLVEKGEDDGITSTLLVHSLHQVVLGKLEAVHHIDSSARAFALLAAYLLQGSRLSLYNRPGNRGCSIIIPLKLGSYDIEMVATPHPCPLSLQKALVGYWKGLTESEPPININTDVIFNIIATCKDSWGNDTDTSSGMQEYQQLISTPQYEGESARDTSKRLLQTFGTPTFPFRRLRSGNMFVTNPEKSSGRTVLSPSDADGPAPLFRQPPKPNMQSDFPLGGSRNYHRATQSWTYNPIALHKQSQQVVSVPRLGMSYSFTVDEPSGPPLLSKTRSETESAQRTESLAGTPPTK